MIAIGNQAHPDFRLRGRFHDLVDDAPDLLLRALDEAAHRAGGVDHEDQFDRRLVTGDVFDLSGRVILSPRGRRREQYSPADEQTQCKTHGSPPEVERVMGRESACIRDLKKESRQPDNDCRHKSLDGVQGASVPNRF